MRFILYFIAKNKDRCLRALQIISFDFLRQPLEDFFSNEIIYSAFRNLKIKQ